MDTPIEIEPPVVHDFLVNEYPVLGIKQPRQKKKKPKQPRIPHTIGGIMQRMGCQVCGAKRYLSLHAATTGKRVLLETLDGMDFSLFRREVRQGHFHILCRDHRPEV